MRTNSHGGVVSRVSIGTAVSLLLTLLATNPAWAISSEQAVVRASKVMLGNARGERRASPSPFEDRRDAIWLRTRDVQVRVPSDAALPITIEETVSGMQVAVSLDGAFDALGSRQLHDGAVGQLLRGSEHSLGVTLIPLANGFEDFVLYERRPNVARITYRVRLTRVAGLRQVANVLELLDRGGAPRLRIPPVTVIDSTGRVIPAKLEVEGCLVDRDPRPPWGRELVEPGSSECRVVVDWSESAVVYPILVDPTWQSTSTLAKARYSHAQVTLADGRVLVAGGGGPGYYASFGELWDPATATWSTTSEYSISHKFTTMEALLDGRALLIGGCQANDVVGCTTGVDTAELYSPSTGVWTTTQMIGKRYNHASARLGDGRVVVAGGCTTTLANCVSDASAATEIFDPATDTWNSSLTIGTRRAFLAATAMDDGTVVFSGGSSLNGTPVAAVQRFTGSSWSTMSNLDFARYGHAMAKLPEGRILVVGGCGDAMCDDKVTQSEYFDPGTNQFHAAPSPTSPVANLTLTSSSQGTALLVGGRNQNDNAEFDTYLFDPVQWDLVSTNILPPRYGHAASKLLDGRVMVTGGADPAALDDTHLFVPDVLDPVPSDAGVGGSAGATGTGGYAGQSAGGFGGSGGSGGSVVADSGTDGGPLGGNSSSGCGCSTMKSTSGTGWLMWILGCVGLGLRARFAARKASSQVAKVSPTRYTR